MVAPRQRRQYSRQVVDLGVQLSIDDSCAQQVAPLNGRRIDARMQNVSAGGARAVTSIYLPRGTLLTIESAKLANLEADRLRARVVSVEMEDAEPHFALGLRFVEDCPELVDRVSSFAVEPPPESQTGRPGTPTELPQWMALLYEWDLADADVLTKAVEKSPGNESAAADWLVSSGCVHAREVAVARAAGHGLAFVDLGDYRVSVENRKVLREGLARAHTIFPVFSLERTITMVAAEPLELAVLDQIRLQTGCEVDVCLTTKRELQHLIEWAYGDFHDQTDASDDSSSAHELAWSDLLDDADNAPVVKLVDVLLDRAVASRASDIHIDAEEDTLRVRFRVDGVLREVPAPPKAMLSAIVARIKVLSQLNIAETRQPQDGHFKLAADREELDVRVSTLPSTQGEAVVLRLLRSGTRLLSLEELGMPGHDLAHFDELIHLPHGMLLVTGPTGSGKTTTLYSALSRLDRIRQSIITLEDPVEIRLSQTRQVAVNPKAGLTFASGLRSILRQDPDIIMVGEIRDRETAEIALQAALTGHLVLSTLHTNTAAAATTRLLDMGVPDFLVASSLVGVLAQRLCRRLCAHCARPAERDADGTLAMMYELVGEGNVLEAAGCKRCAYTGYEGRVGIFELLTVRDDIRRAILDHRDDQAVGRLARQGGMCSMLEDGITKIRQGATTVAEVLRVAGRPESWDSVRDGLGTRTSAPSHAPLPDFSVQEYELLLQRWLEPRPSPADAGRSS